MFITSMTRSMCGRQPAAQVPPSEAVGHVQGRTDELQGAPHSNTGVSQQSVADPLAGTVSVII